MAHRSLFLLVLLATAAASSCTDPSPVEPTAPQSPLRLPGKGGSTGNGTTTALSGLVSCSQAYDSVTQAIGPAGGSLTVGAHTLYVNSLALSSTVKITAVAPASVVRWVRFQPDGLVFQTNLADGWGAMLFTSYKDCGVPTSDTLRIAQVTDQQSVLGYLSSASKIRRNPWSQANQFVVGLLQHFSNYAVAW